jgi:hypothetical protein
MSEIFVTASEGRLFHADRTFDRIFLELSLCLNAETSVSNEGAYSDLQRA